MDTCLPIEGKLLRGVFLGRPNRFLAHVAVEGRLHPSYLPNPGRIQELLAPGAEVVLSRVRNPGRKTHFDLLGVVQNGQIASIDSRVPNKLVL